MENGLTYIRAGDYYIPSLVADEPEPVRPVGKYGSLWRTYLKQCKHDLWRELAGSGKLTAHLLDIDQMAWVGLMNNCEAQVEEIIFAELIMV